MHWLYWMLSTRLQRAPVRWAWKHTNAFCFLFFLFFLVILQWFSAFSILMRKRRLKLDCNSCMLGTIQNTQRCAREHERHTLTPPLSTATLTLTALLVEGEGGVGACVCVCVWKFPNSTWETCSQSQRGQLFSSVQYPASVQQLSAFIEVSVRKRKREKERRVATGWSRMWQTGALSVSDSLFYCCCCCCTESWECSGTCTPLELNE